MLDIPFSGQHLPLFAFDLNLTLHLKFAFELKFEICLCIWIEILNLANIFRFLKCNILLYCDVTKFPEDTDSSKTPELLGSTINSPIIPTSCQFIQFVHIFEFNLNPSSICKIHLKREMPPTVDSSSSELFQACSMFMYWCYACFIH